MGASCCVVRVTVFFRLVRVTVPSKNNRCIKSDPNRQTHLYPQVTANLILTLTLILKISKKIYSSNFLILEKYEQSPVTSNFQENHENEVKYHTFTPSFADFSPPSPKHTALIRKCRVQKCGCDKVFDTIELKREHYKELGIWGCKKCNIRIVSRISKRIF